jgi:hypothetical protein
MEHNLQVEDKFASAKIMKFLVSFFVMSVAIVTMAQPPDTMWTKVFGGNARDWGYSVLETDDGGFILVGETQAVIAGDQDVWLIKTDYRGNLEWDRTFGGADNEVGVCIQRTNDEGYIIAGEFSSPASLSDVLLIKTRSDGEEEWTRTFGGANFDGGSYVQQTTDGGYIIVGRTNSFSIGYDDVWLIKTDDNGFEQWGHTYGGTNSESGKCVEQTPDGGYIITGYTYSFGSGQYDVWLIKTDSSGNEEWNRTYGGANNDIGNAVRQTTDGGYIIAGETSSIGEGGSDMWIIKTDSVGNRLWDHTFGRSQSDFACDIRQTSDGGYVIVGGLGIHSNYDCDVWIIKTDAEGDSLWSIVFGGNDMDWGYCIQQTSDEGYVVVGWTESYGTGDDVDVLLLRYEGTSGVESNRIQLIPQVFSLHPAYPNPFNSTTNLTFDVPHSSFVDLFVYDVLGRKVTELYSGWCPAGTYSTSFNGNDLPSGIYFCRMSVGDFIQTRKLLLLK